MQNTLIDEKSVIYDPIQMLAKVSLNEIIGGLSKQIPEENVSLELQWGQLAFFGLGSNL